jgi:hypothetical protein
MHPERMNPLQWHPAIGVARQTCARVFRDGGTPADALALFGIQAGSSETVTWSRAVELIADHLCAHGLRVAA